MSSFIIVLCEMYYQIERFMLFLSLVRQICVSICKWRWYKKMCILCAVVKISSWCVYFNVITVSVSYVLLIRQLPVVIQKWRVISIGATNSRLPLWCCLFLEDNPYDDRMLCMSSSPRIVSGRGLLDRAINRTSIWTTYPGLSILWTRNSFGETIG